MIGLGGGPITALALVGLVGGLVAVAVVWARSYRRTGDAERATDQTSRRVVAVVSAALFALVAALVNFAGLFGTVGDLVTMAPGGFGQLALGFLAVAGFAGWIELTAVTATVLVVVIIAGVAAIRN